ncbi:uncharacterized protein LOC128953471 [Oppia nitens]|uniref:uncharacterized protein LOC128953471 n=1 Tax=Oppia nitens TaxID=1686743 RepID=UPI0023DC3082|nr:uncharacterized protein LOC128953471 [Oppia nitens]
MEMSEFDRPLYVSRIADELPEYRKHFQSIISEILDSMVGNDNDISELRPRLDQLFDYFYVQHPRLKYGIRFILSYRILTDKQHSGQQQQQQLESGAGNDGNTQQSIVVSNESVYALAVAVELITMSLILLDDIMDKATLRYGIPSWYTLPSVGMSALNDSTVMLTMSDKIVNQYYHGHPNYIQIVQCIQEFIEKISMGQSLDMMYSLSTKQNKNLKLTDFNMAIFDKLNKYKNAFSVYVYQFKLAIILADKQQYDNKFVETIENFLIDMGILSGALNDYQDYYEQGIDIQEGKCTWLICRSMQLADNRQLAQLVDNYGHENADRVQQICRIFDELDMKSEVRKFADNMFNKYQQLAANDYGNDLLVKQIVDNISYEVRYYAKICHIYE